MFDYEKHTAPSSDTPDKKLAEGLLSSHRTKNPPVRLQSSGDNSDIFCFHLYYSYIFTTCPVMSGANFTGFWHPRFSSLYSNY